MNKNKRHKWIADNADCAPGNTTPGYLSQMAEIELDGDLLLRLGSKDSSVVRFGIANYNDKGEPLPDIRPKPCPPDVR